MSLQLAAQHLASRGRGPDTQLIHMAPQEVAGLHALAKAHGGSLTTNPDTGLPEAGFLSSILPMVIGGALTVASGGTLTPLMAGMMTGAGYGVATGSLQKGLMAGLGAFGGAGLAGGLMGAGAAAGTAGTGLTATGGVMGANPMIAQPMTFGAETLGSAAGQGVQVGAPILDAANMSQTGTNFFGPAGTVPPPAPVAGPTAQAFTGGTPQVATATPMADRFSQLGQGFKGLGTEAGREAFMGNAASKGVEATGVGGLGGLAKYGMAAAAPIMFQEPKAAAKPPEEKPYEYSYSSGYNPTPDEGYTGAYTGERTHFDHRFTRKAAGGGLMGIQPIEAMSQQNQTQMRPAYAQGGVSDMAVNPYTGSESFADGGDTTAKDPYNTMTGQSADMYNYLMGQGPRPAAAPRAPAPVMAATPAPVAVPDAQPVVGGLGRVARQLSGASAEPLTMSYTFDPVTGGFRKLAPTEADFDAPAPAPQMDSGGGYAHGGIASLAEGGQSHLGDYSDGGRLLRGPGDGVSDSIPASIGDKRPARLADGEFVVSADVVSGLGNGSTEAGARKLYAMMDRIRKARTGTKKMGKTVNPDKLVPA